MHYWTSIGFTFIEWRYKIVVKYHYGVDTVLLCEYWVRKITRLGLVLISPESKINWSNQSPPSPEPYRLNQSAALGIRLYTDILHFQPFLWVLYLDSWKGSFIRQTGCFYPKDRVSLSKGQPPLSMQRTGFLYPYDRVSLSIGQGLLSLGQGSFSMKERVPLSEGKGSFIRRTRFLYPWDRFPWSIGHGFFICRIGFLH